MDYKLQEVTKIKLKNEEDENHYYYYYEKREVLHLLAFKDKILIVQRNKHINIINKNNLKLYSLIKKIEDDGFFSATILTSSGDIACCGDNGTISIFKIKPILCQLRQTIPILDKKKIYRIKEITNNKLISNQDEKSLIFYEYKNNKLKLTNKIIMENYIENFLPTKNNDILLYANFFCPKYHFKILLFDSEKLKIIKEVLSCNGNSAIYEPFSFLTKNIVAIVIAETLFLVDINNDYSIITQIFESKSRWINSICCLDHKKIVTGDAEGNLILWNYEKNNIKKIGEYSFKKKNNNSSNGLTSLLKINKNLFLVGGEYYLFYACNYFRENIGNKERSNNH